MDPWLALIESNTSGTGRLFARAAVHHGYRPILITDNLDRYPYISEDHLDVLQTSTQDETALLQACQKLDGGRKSLAGITSSSEYYIASAAKLAQKFGLPGPDPVALSRCRDKYRQRQQLQTAGVSVPSFCQVTSREGTVRAVDRLGLPVIVKPVSGSGSVGVKLCRNREDAAAHACRLLEQTENERGIPVSQRILIESMAIGPEFSVETFSGNVVGITQKHLGSLPHFVEVGHDFPAQLSTNDTELIYRVALHTLHVLGLGWGPAHIELRLTKDGPQIIEVNPRLAGGYIVKLVRLATGIDLVSQAIRLVAGLQTELLRIHSQAASIRFLLPQEEGVLVGADGLAIEPEDLHVIETRLYTAVGSRVRRHGDFRDRVGHVLTAGPNLEISRSAAEKKQAAIRLHIAPERKGTSWRTQDASREV